MSISYDDQRKCRKDCTQALHYCLVNLQGTFNCVLDQVAVIVIGIFGGFVFLMIIVVLVALLVKKKKKHNVNVDLGTSKELQQTIRTQIDDVTGEVLAKTNAYKLLTKLPPLQKEKLDYLTLADYVYQKNHPNNY